MSSPFQLEVGSGIHNLLLYFRMPRISGKYKSIDIELIQKKFQESLNEFWNSDTSKYESHKAIIEEEEDSDSESRNN